MPSVAKDFLDIIKDIRGTNFDTDGTPLEGFWYDVKTWHTEVEADNATVAAAAAIVAADKALVAADTATTTANTATTVAAAAAAALSETNANVSANSSATYSSNALVSQNLAADWAAKTTDILVDGVNYSAKHHATKAAASAGTASTDATTATNNRSYTQEWAAKAEDSPVSIAAGGNGTSDYSAYHYSRKASVSSATAVASAATASADAITAASAASTATTAASNATSASITSTTNANTASTKSAEAVTARDAAYDWAQAAEDVGVNDGVNPAGFSAYHWSQKAAAVVGGITNFVDLSDVPGTYAGQSNKILRVNTPANGVEFFTIAKSDVGLSNVDNTSDANKPISSFTQTALDAKANNSALALYLKHDGSVPLTGNLEFGAGLGAVFEGTTANDFETTLIAGEPTADRIIALPNESGTLATRTNAIAMAIALG